MQALAACDTGNDGSHLKPQPYKTYRSLRVLDLVQGSQVTSRAVSSVLLLAWFLKGRVVLYG